FPVIAQYLIYTSLNLTVPLSIMFSNMKIFNVIKKNYNIEFTKILSDNGAEFTFSKNHPFERILLDAQLYKII
ncbi:hypothetical protein, partial [Rickettsia sp. wb]